MRILFPRFLLILAAVLALAACNGNKSNDTSSVIATVNGTPITNNMFRAYVRTLTGGRDVELNKTQHDQVLQHMVEMMLLAQKAEQSGLANDPKTAAELAVQHDAKLAQSEVQNYVEKHPVTDDELKAEYAANTHGQPVTEYRARHILVQDEKTAKNIIRQLEKGGDFAKLAAKYSLDPSGKKGGELGWFTSDKMVPEFSAAVESLKKNEITKTPVHTRYGWHVIQLEDTREAAEPPMDSLRQEYENKVQERNFEKFVKDLRKDAKIDIKTPPATTAAAPATADPTQEPANK